jgi:hypothetical protein
MRKRVEPMTTQAERSELAERLVNVKEYSNEHLIDVAMRGKLLLSAKSPFILVSAETRDAIIAALRS